MVSSNVFREDYGDVEAHKLQPNLRKIVLKALTRDFNAVLGDEEVSQDWIGFVEEMNGTYDLIHDFWKERDPPESVFNHYVKEEALTMGKLLAVMTSIGLEGPVGDLRRHIETDSDALNYVDTVQSFAVPVRVDVENLLGATRVVESSPSITVRETLDDISDFHQDYDVFFSFNYYDEEDCDFATTVVDKLEKKGFKIFMKGRDPLSGAKYELMTELIRTHCRKVIILLSPSYTSSDECDFVLKYAQSIDTGARKSKILPILRTPDSPLPHIINFLELIDAKIDMGRGWFYPKLYRHLTLASTSVPSPLAPPAPPAPKLPTAPSSPPSCKSSSPSPLMSGSTSSLSLQSSISKSLSSLELNAKPSEKKGKKKGIFKAVSSLLHSD